MVGDSERDKASERARLTLVLPLPPSVNHQYVTAGRRRVLSREAQSFRRDVAKTVQRLREVGKITPAIEAALKEAYLGVRLTFFFETPYRRDLDGGLKIALDAACDALGLDDRYVVEMLLTKRIDPLRPRLLLELVAIPDWQFDQAYVYLGPREQDGGS
ncbi:MAG TPA: RusA family crossover junction endodeoxyribonuclease [Thermomicrobiales bacterium]